MDRRALSLALSRAAASTVREALSQELPSLDGVRVIGITGPPGVGKSTLIGRLVSYRLRADGDIAVLAIDPSSPQSGGSLLGDRIRMEAISDHARVFIRSMPSGGASGGLSDNIADVLATLNASGFQEIVIETVGVGQAEYGVRALADAEVLVLMPGAGDHIQAMKAGITETADIFVVNKADLPGAERLEAELLGVLQHQGTTPPIIRVSAGSEEGIYQLSDALNSFLSERQNRQDADERRRTRQRFRVQALLHRRVTEILDHLPDEAWNQSAREIYSSALLRIARDT